MVGGGKPALSSDTTTYADSLTRALVQLGVDRFRAQDSTVENYRAQIRYRLSFAMGKRAWADLANVAVEELDGSIAWQLPNDLRVDLLGRRADTRIQGVDLSSEFNRPLFLPRGLSDSVRIFGLRTPAAAAPHPLSAGAAEHYRYSAGGLITLSRSEGVIRVREVTFVPKGEGPSYLAGKLWLDTDTGDLVRIIFRFVGTGLWERTRGDSRQDTTASERTNQLINQILQIEADLEYGLQDNRYWMPFRQTVSGRFILPLGIELAIPFQATTSFSDYQINQGSVVNFTALQPDSIPGERAGGNRRPGSLRIQTDSLGGSESYGRLPGGGRYQIHRPPADSLRDYAAWGDSLQMEENPLLRSRTREAVATLAAIVESLPGGMTGQRRAGWGVERAAELLRYNRIQGTTLTLGGKVPLPLAYGEAAGHLRYSLADQRITGGLALRRDAPAARTTLTLSRDLVDHDPLTSGLSFGNSLRAALTGRDEGAYLLAQGARISYQRSVGLARELTLTGIAEHQSSVTTAARAGLPRLLGRGGYFPGNPSVREGVALGGSLLLEQGYWGTRSRIELLGLSVAGQQAARAVAELTLPDLLLPNSSLHLVGGAAIGSNTVPQAAMLAGGSRTVRGFDYGIRSGPALWAAQLDWTPGGGGIKPLIFFDVGSAGNWQSLRQEPVLLGGGAGLSLLGGLLRTTLSIPIYGGVRDQWLRFDLNFGGFR